MNTPLKIELPFNVEPDGKRGLERLSVEEIAPGRYRLLHSPGMVEGLAAGDIFETSTNSPGYKIIERGGNVCVWFFFPQRGQNHGTFATKLRLEVEQLGGWLDGGGETSLVFTIPVRVGFGDIERVLSRAVDEFEGSTCLYGNVYDVDGETPLNWWSTG